MYYLKWSLLIMLGTALSVWKEAHPVQDPEPAFQYVTSDSVVLDIYETYDTAGLLAGYRTHVISPVCEKGECYPVELDFFWDLLGKFIRFEIDPEQPLTKLDHVPFTTDDYKKLEQILRTQSPSFIHLRRAELVMEPTGDEELDGVTGATVKAIEKDMVAGAIYTCYTLWHIANGGITFKIQEHSRNKLNRSLIRQMLSDGEAGMHYFLIEHMESEYLPDFLSEILQLAGQYDAYFATRVGERLPAAFFARPEVQQFFRQHFPRLDQPTQLAWLEKMQEAETIEYSTLQLLTKQTGANKPEHTEKIVQLLTASAPKAEVALLHMLFVHLLEGGDPLPPRLLAMLRPVAEKDRTLKKLFKRLKKL
jgi:hypothetical protein